MNISNEILQEIILNKIKLFTKENYFKYFKNMLIDLSQKTTAFQKKASLSVSIAYITKDEIHKSWWQLITKLIFPKNDKHSNIKIKFGEAYDSFPDLNPLCFEYLKNLCHIRMKQIASLSLNEQIPLNRILPLYLFLCEKQIKMNREKQFGIYQIRQEESFKKIPKKNMLLFNNYNRQNSLINISNIKLVSKKVGGKNLQANQQLDYTNSFTRLFIGETDIDSIRERYLSNMVVKKHKQLQK